MLQRFLDPSILAGISGLDLVAKTVVDGFVAGLHRSPDFGFSQEFAEYQAYTPGDDLRNIDWNVYARSEKLYLKRYRGETNSFLTILLDASNSMQFGSHRVNKMDYARYLAASLFYLAIHEQRDAAGLITFDDEIRNYIRPSTRQGQLHRLLAGLEQAEARARTDFAKPMRYFQEFLKRRGMVLIVSDFWESPESIIRTIEPLRFHGNEVVLFHVLDPEDVRPKLNGPSILVDMETQEELEVTPDYAKKEYREKIDAHLADLRDRSPGRGHGLLPAHDRPAARRRAARIPHPARRPQINGTSRPLVPCRSGGARASALPAFVEAANHHAQAGELADVLRVAHPSLDPSSPAPLFPAAVAAAAVAAAVDSRLRQSLHQPQHGHSCQRPAGASGGRQLLQHARRNAFGRREGRGA